MIKIGGNAIKDGLLNSLNNYKMLYAKNLIQGKITKTPHIHCLDCDIYKYMKYNNMYLKMEKKRIPFKLNIDDIT